MSTHNLHLDEATFALALRLANERKVSVDELITTAIEQLSDTPAPHDACDLIGGMSEYADVLDDVVAEAYRQRAQRPLRTKSA